MADAGDIERVSLLIVDDDRTFREVMAQAFRRRGYEVRVAGSAEEALQLCEGFVPERAIVDLRMPGASGIELLRALKKIDPETQVVVLTGYGSIPTAVEAVRAGALNYLTKPVEPAEVEAVFLGQKPVENSVTPTGTPSLERTEWEHIQRVLADCQQNISEAARRLGLHRRTLQRKLQKRPRAR